MYFKCKTKHFCQKNLPWNVKRIVNIESNHVDRATVNSLLIVDTVSNGESFFHSNDVGGLADYHIIGMSVTARRLEGESWLHKEFTVQTLKPGHSEEDCPITTFSDIKRFSSSLANGPMTFINLRAISWKVR